MCWFGQLYLFRDGVSLLRNNEWWETETGAAIDYMLFHLITGKPGALLCIRAVASRGPAGMREDNFCSWVCVNAFSQLTVTHIFLKLNIILVQKPPSSASVLGKCWCEVVKKKIKQADFSPFLTVNLHEQSKRGLFFHNKTSVSATVTLHFSFYPLNTTDHWNRKQGTQDTGSQSKPPGTRVQTLLWRIF